MSENVCLSGGAIGADTAWGYAALRAGHKVIHYTFAGHTAAVANTVRLSDAEMLEADPALVAANRALKRRFPSGSNFVNNLLRRNFWQIRDTERVYAVAHLQGDRFVAGGTAWAIEMYLQRASAVPECYIFNTGQGCWFRWDAAAHMFLTIGGKPPVPHGRYTGIGTRDLDGHAGRAIQDVFAGPTP